MSLRDDLHQYARRYATMLDELCVSWSNEGTDDVDKLVRMAAFALAAKRIGNEMCEQMEETLEELQP